MSNDDQQRVHPDLVENVRELFEMRKAAEGDEPQVLNERVDVVLEGVGNGPFRVKKRDFEFVVDEPPARAGTDEGPNPLAFFLGGAGTCYLSHFMLIAIRENIGVDSLKLVARAHFDRRLVGGILKDVIYDLRLESEAAPSDVEAVAREAEKACYAHNTLVSAGVELTTTVSLNGEALVTLVADTSHLS